MPRSCYQLAGSIEGPHPDWPAALSWAAAADAGSVTADPAVTDDELVGAGELQAVSSRAEEMTAKAAGVRRIGYLSSGWEPED